MPCRQAAHGTPESLDYRSGNGSGDGRTRRTGGGMKIETTFSCGDRAWVFHNGRAVQLTIGQVQVVHTDSPGMEQPDIQFDNYAKQQDHKEAYMCVESGIGSGSVYTLGEHI